ncbi:MAG TPA: response regulator [Actinomycetota bacterium]|nr:response regulator [Actinomycetota bacterium]
MRKILVVENDRISRDLASAVLTRGGYDVVCARDGEEALLVAPSLAADLVLMDVGLPGIDGIEVVETLQHDRRTAETPVVVWSALTMPQDVERAWSAGCAAYLAKPVGARELLQSIDAVFGVTREKVS